MGRLVRPLLLVLLPGSLPAHADLSLWQWVSVVIGLVLLEAAATARLAELP